MVSGCGAEAAEERAPANPAANISGDAGAAAENGGAIAAASASDSAADSAATGGRAAERGSGAQGGSTQRAARVTDGTIVRGLYVNRWATQSPARMRGLIAIADSTEINALVLDIKDEFGLNYRSQDSSVARNAGSAGRIPGLPALLDSLHAHGIVAIARLVVFKDSVAARLNPDRTILTPGGDPWRDKQGLTWVNPYDRVIQEYNIRVAEELARLGFDEIQFDYIRFPEPYQSLPPQNFPGAEDVSKAQALATFLGRACPRIRAAGALCTADVFGLVTTVNGALEIGQQWEALAEPADVLLPMVYPSHYPRGAFGLDRPNADPHEVIVRSVSRARERDEALGLPGVHHVRPWLQAFSLGQPEYGAEELAAQIRGVYDAGVEGWILWHPGSLYGPYLAVLEETLIARADSAAATTP